MSRRARVLLVALLFVPALALKVAHVWRAQDPGVDGGYYTDVARHVRDGRGLSTSVSLYHQGFERFPHASPIYPVWPLVHGWTARVLPLTVAGRVVPAVGWVIACVFAGLWVRRLAPGSILGATGIDAGHAAAMLLAPYAVFFRYTSRPYTEGVSFALLFAGLWWLHPRWSRLSIGTGFAMGAWLGALVLVRSQLLVVAMAAACALAFAIVFVPPRVRAIEASLACASALAATVTPQLLRVAEWTVVSPWIALLRFEMARERELLSRIDVLADGGSGILGHLGNFAAGLPVAFWPTGSMTYERVFHGLQFALPIAFVVLVADGIRGARAGRVSAWLESWRTTDRLALVFALALAAGGFLSLHFIRKDFTTEWHFARRHALTSFFAFVLAWVYLVRHASPMVRRTAFALAAFTLVVSHAQAFKSVRMERPGKIRSYDVLLSALDAERDRAGSLVVALHGDHLQRIVWRTEGIGFHWIYDKTTASDADSLAKLGVRWMLLEREQTRDWPLREALLGPAWRRLPDVDGFEVFEATPQAGTAGAGHLEAAR